MKNIVLRSIAFNYPGFQSLPRGIKKMLVVTESFFFSEENGRNRADVRPISPQPLSATPMGRVSLSLGSA
jgi:hypothetical protein